MALFDKFRKPTLCDSCARLLSKVGKEYRCRFGHSYSMWFDKAPSYCINYKLREEDGNGTDCGGEIEGKEE